MQAGATDPQHSSSASEVLKNALHGGGILQCLANLVAHHAAAVATPATKSAARCEGQASCHVQVSFERWSMCSASLQPNASLMEAESCIDVEYGGYFMRRSLWGFNRSLVAIENATFACTANEERLVGVIMQGSNNQSEHHTEDRLTGTEYACSLALDRQSKRFMRTPQLNMSSATHSASLCVTCIPNAAQVFSRVYGCQ